MRLINADLLKKEFIKDTPQGCGTVGIKYIDDLIKKQPTANEWILCSERLPNCEIEVQVTTRKKIKDGTYRYLITNGFYEDGTMLEDNSDWFWNECNFEKFDDEEDCYIIDEGWWEYKHYNPDDVYNNAIDDEVIAWMPLPQPYTMGERKEDDEDE